MYFTKCFSRPQPSLLHTHGLEGASSSCVPERGIPRKGEQCPVIKFSYQGYSPPKMHMQWHITTSTFHTIYNAHMEWFVSCMKCFHAHTPSHRLSHTCLCPAWQLSLIIPISPIYGAFVSSPTPNAIFQWVANPESIPTPITQF